MQGTTGMRLLSKNKLAPPEMPALPDHLQASADNYYINTIAIHDKCHHRSVDYLSKHISHIRQRSRDQSEMPSSVKDGSSIS